MGDEDRPMRGGGMNEGTASRKRGAPSTSDTSGRKRAKLKRAKCEHGIEKYSCKECGGKAICAHGRQKRQCKVCDGSGICPHRRRKQRCKECGETCSHGTKMYKCKVCRLKAPPTATPADDVKWTVTWGIELALRDLAKLRSIPLGAAQAS